MFSRAIASSERGGIGRLNEEIREHEAGFAEIAGHEIERDAVVIQRPAEAVGRGIDEVIFHRG